MNVIKVIATTYDGTRAAIETAVPLARGSGCRLVVVVPKIVPYPIALEAAADTTELAAHQYRHLIQRLNGDGQVEVCVCRTIQAAIAQLVESDALVIVGGACGHWLMSPEERFANRLSRLGHRVIFAASGPCPSARRVAFPVSAALAMLLACTSAVDAQPASAGTPLTVGAFADVAALVTPNVPVNHLFRNRGTTPRVDGVELNMAAAYLRKPSSEGARAGYEATVQAGEDSKLFGFSATAPNVAGADWLRHLGPTNVSYLAPVGGGLEIQTGIFNSLIGYDSLYAKDNFSYTRPWGADYTPYLMLGVNAAYAVNPRLTATAVVVNGYWHLAHANDVPSVGGQLAYKATDRVTVKQTVLEGPHQADTSFAFWRFLSDTIVERKADRLTTAGEYQIGLERLDEPGRPRAWWMAAQLPLRWRAGSRTSVAVRPELCWDSRGRWTGFEQTVTALTATLEYRMPYRAAQAIVRGEYRVDNAQGPGGGFFDGRDRHGIPTLTATQQLFGVALLLTFDTTSSPE